MISTAYEMGWSALSNGDLMDAAEAQFDNFVTTDQNLEYQQNLSKLDLGLAVLVAKSNRLVHLRR